MKINTNEIERKGRYIQLAPGLTATEGQDGNLATLSIRKEGRRVKFYKGSSLVFAGKLTAEDKDYLASLVEGV